MPIIVNLDVMMAKRKISLNELSERVDLTLSNLSILKTGKAKAIRFSTLEAICKALDCQPGKYWSTFRKGNNETSNLVFCSLIKPHSSNYSGVTPPLSPNLSFRAKRGTLPYLFERSEEPCLQHRGTEIWRNTENTASLSVFLCTSVPLC